MRTVAEATGCSFAKLSTALAEVWCGSREALHQQSVQLLIKKKLLVLRFMKNRSNTYKLLVFDQKITYNIVIPGSI